MRIRNLNPGKYDDHFIKLSMQQLRGVAEVIAKEARAMCPVGTISRPIYRSGPYAGEKWTARDAGALRKTIRVVEKWEAGDQLAKANNIRVYAGNFNVYYAQVVEFAGQKFLRPAAEKGRQLMKSILGGT